MARPPPYPFLFEHLLIEGVVVKPMFGHHAVYVGDKLVLFLIDKPGERDNGVCLATSAASIPLLTAELPALRHLFTYGPNATDWRVIPADAPDFEAAVTHACELICRGDPRIGRLPKSGRANRSKAARASKAARRSKSASSSKSASASSSKSASASSSKSASASSSKSASASSSKSASSGKRSSQKK